MKRTHRHSPTTGTDRKPQTQNQKRIRIVALDGIRGLLALHIVCGHFLRFAGPSKFVWQFFAQVNVTVGAFFALSGYVTAYTCTKVGASAMNTDASSASAFEACSRKQWWMSKAMTFYPMHWFVLLLFSPMFVYSDVSAASTSTLALTRGLVASLTNGILSFTLTQAWFPIHHAEIWNAPTWFLSSLSFGNAVLAMALPRISTMDQVRLRRASVWLYWINVVPVVVYFACVRNSLGLVEGTTPPKEHPSIGLFNIIRFFPVFNAAETLMGAVACRMVMMDVPVPGAEYRDEDTVVTRWTFTSTATVAAAVPFGMAMGILVGRAWGWIPDCSDLFIRKFFFVPLFLAFVMALHRNAMLQSKSKPNNSHHDSNATRDPVSALLSTKVLVWLGTLSFPIYILHGPIGHVFYKRVIATKLWGGVLRGKGYFALYLASVLLSAVLVQKIFSNRNNGGVIEVATKTILKCFGS